MKKKNQSDHQNYVSSGEYPSGNNQQYAQPNAQGYQTRPLERTAEEKNRMFGYIDTLLHTAVRQDSPFIPVIRELQLESVENAEYQLLQIDPNSDPALYNYLMGMVFWLRGYQNEAGQRFLQAMQTAPQIQVYTDTYNYQWGVQGSEQTGKEGKSSDKCCTGMDVCECICCCADISKCLGS